MSTFLATLEFDQNRYDPYTTNKVIDGSICTITWHVDDLEISHTNKDTVSKIIDKLEGQYGKMIVNIGNEYTYFGMNLINNTDSSVTVDMANYFEEAINEFGKDCNRKINNSVAIHLFEMTDNQVKLDNDKKTLFHCIVAKLLFMGKQERPDIQVVVAFLTRRVTKPDQDDWKKLH